MNGKFLKKKPQKRQK